MKGGASACAISSWSRSKYTRAYSPTASFVRISGGYQWEPPKISSAPWPLCTTLTGWATSWDKGQKGTSAVDPDAAVIGPEALRHQIGIAELVARDAADAVEADRERLEIRGLAGFRPQRDDERAVEAAGEQHAHRHVGDAPALDRGLEAGEHRGAPVRHRHGAILATRHAERHHISLPAPR